MARIPEHIIENVRQVADIYDIVSEHVNLKKRGRNFFGLCPFHNEKTPSFSLNIDKQIYKCFGCGKGGGTINFIMDIEKLDFLDAVKYLGSKYNIEVNLEHNSKSNNDLFNQLYSMHELAKDEYKKNISDQVIQFLNDRNINQDSIDTFEIGLTLTKYDELLQIMREKQYSAEALNKSGLFINHEKGYMDRFRNRIMFPIYNSFNKPIAFGGRVFNNETKIAKYLNSSETPIYNKSKILYGIHITKNEIINKNSVIVVEGYLDLIQLYQANIKNVVSVSGTAFTNEHAKIITKLCKTVYIAYDGDEAGINSAIRAGYTILKGNLEAKIINMPIGLDPDDWIQKEGEEPFKEAMKNSNSILEFHYKNQIKEDNNERDKINFINEVISEISQLEDDLIVESLIKELSLITGFKVESIFNALSKIKNKKYTKSRSIEKVEPSISKNQTNITLIDKEIIMFCFSKDLENRMLIKKHLNPEWIQSDLIKNIYNEILIHLSSKDVVKPEIVMNELKNENERNLMAELLLNQININKKVIIDCLIRMEKNKLQNQLNNLREQLKTIENEDRKQTLLLDINEFQKQKNSLKNKYIND
tara:strand:- start:169 stop:1935 length:1767 start_codon:yes stop_codon:yes gene_type:complete